MTENGDFVKAYGADWGFVRTHNKWVSFQCFGCAVAQGFIFGKRLSNGDHPRLHQRMGFNFTIKHSAEVHNSWLKSGKPFGGQK